MPAAPGFKKVRIAPNPGSLEWIEGSMPWQDGEIIVSLKVTKKNGLTGEVELPVGLNGTFVWKDKELNLQPGINPIEL